MKENKKLELEKTAKEMMGSTFVQRLSWRYPIKIFSDGDQLIIRIELRDMKGKPIDVFDIPADSKGFVHFEVVLDYVVTAFEVGLESSVWTEASKRWHLKRF